MTAPTFSARYFAYTVSAHPGNAVFYSSEILLDAIKNTFGDFSLEDRATAIAELAARYYLSRDDSFLPVLEGVFGSERLRDFLARCALVSCGKDSLDGLRQTLDGQPGDVVAGALCARFSDVLSADGVIPVFNPADGEAWLLPFSFFGEAATGAPVVVDAAGTRIAAWSDEMANLPEPVGGNVRVGIALPKTLSCLPMGSSLLLPVLAAWWRHEGKIPRYDTHRLVFTGSFRAGLLSRVETKEKARKMSAVKGGILFSPSESHSRPTRTSLPEGSSVGEVLKAVRALAEEECESSLCYAKGRIRDFETDVRQRCFAGWGAVLRRLENVCAGLKPGPTPSAWLTGLLLRAAANCHAGNTEEAARLNAEAVAFCEGKPKYEDKLLRALVDQLVILQDFEDFDRLFDLAPGLGERIDAFACEKGGAEPALDLQMRFHGSMGQFHAYACLAGIRPGECSPASAKGHLDAAFETAQSLCEEAEGDALAIRLGDVAQDANYLLLWHSLFDVGGVPSAFETALECVEPLCPLDAEAGRKNRLFAHRDAAMGLYRAVLRGEAVPQLGNADFREVLASTDENGWIAGTTAKYLGAVAAVAGVKEEAARLFDMAAQAVDPGARGVLGVIRMTIHAEAFRSLQRFPEFAARAEECRAEALRFFETGDSAAATKTAWRAWLEEPSTAPFPGLSYWY
ncbi:MAG: hypothetical protein ILM98_01655 [Kiritimatiellae bacterium]|nr:hypothetical protein [Kiritimatiellia bacterium]